MKQDEKGNDYFGNSGVLISILSINNQLSAGNYHNVKMADNFNIVRDYFLCISLIPFGFSQY